MDTTVGVSSASSSPRRPVTTSARSKKKTWTSTNILVTLFFVVVGVVEYAVIRVSVQQSFQEEYERKLSTMRTLQPPKRLREKWQALKKKKEKKKKHHLRMIEAQTKNTSQEKEEDKPEMMHEEEEEEEEENEEVVDAGSELQEENEYNKEESTDDDDKDQKDTNEAEQEEQQQEEKESFTEQGEEEEPDTEVEIEEEDFGKEKGNTVEVEATSESKNAATAHGGNNRVTRDNKEKENNDNDGGTSDKVKEELQEEMEIDETKDELEQQQGGGRAKNDNQAADDDNHDKPETTESDVNNDDDIDNDSESEKKNDNKEGDDIEKEEEDNNTNKFVTSKTRKGAEEEGKSIKSQTDDINEGQHQDDDIRTMNQQEEEEGTQSTPKAKRTSAKDEENDKTDTDTGLHNNEDDMNRFKENDHEVNEEEVDVDFDKELDTSTTPKENRVGDNRRFQGDKKEEIISHGKDDNDHDRKAEDEDDSSTKKRKKNNKKNTDQGDATDEDKDKDKDDGKNVVKEADHKPIEKGDGGSNGDDEDNHDKGRESSVASTGQTIGDKNETTPTANTNSASAAPGKGADMSDGDTTKIKDESPSNEEPLQKAPQGTDNHTKSTLDCFQHNSKSWMTQPAFSNTNEKTLGDNHVDAINSILVLHEQDWLNDTNWNMLSSTTTCDEASLFRSNKHFLGAHDKLADHTALVDTWQLRLFFMALHYFHHEPAFKEASLRKQCVETQNADFLQSGVGPYDYECPSQKFLAIGLSSRTLGQALMEAVHGLLLGVALNRVTVFVNNIRSLTERMDERWPFASCERYDLQCFFLPTTPCTIGIPDLKSAPVVQIVSDEVTVTSLEEQYASDKVIVLEKQFNYLAVKGSLKQARDVLIDHVGQLDKTFLENLGLDDLKYLKDAMRHISVEAASKQVNVAAKAALLYLMRVHPYHQKQIQKRAAKSLPYKLIPEEAIGLWLSDCRPGSSCSSISSDFVEAVKQIGEPELHGDDHSFVVLTNEDILQRADKAPLGAVHFHRVSLVVPPTSGNMVDRDAIMMNRLVDVQALHKTANVVADCSSDLIPIISELVMLGRSAEIPTKIHCLHEMMKSKDSATATGQQQQQQKQ